ncbi:MAG: UDP-N-acetylmuramoyl-L-alanyl-D-glutamate--2,6-diaminopimelate ligase [Roseomonas sp.]|nr:UDP-N-acetylmuramoyl-L-alanyl-D-glutamate--2,6-diaminopimelate ligase [Roseomonas sp.]MCA3431388.1 UDP-N-acetylmuramoyl-L-alanyl-D-glutamate--2,6-diaminopimelate ligase [Roseomonas sp.]
MRGWADAQAHAALKVIGITADSRAVRPGMVFAALPGARNDGRAFIADAVARGAAAILAPEGTAWPAEAPVRPLVTSPDPRRALALMAAAFYGAQPECVVAITGTNGKTSSVDFLRQIWRAAGRKGASLGTLGLITEGVPPGPSLTTPDPVALHENLARLSRDGVMALAMEASSHGIDQRRLDGVVLAAAGFTNLTRDHLDYHGSMTAYRAAKLRLFDTLLPAGAPAIAMADMEAETLTALRDIAARRGLDLRLVGAGGDALALEAARPLPEGQQLSFRLAGARHEVLLPLPGRFQADNALLATMCALVTGVTEQAALAALAHLQAVRGRMERAAILPNGAAIYVDYAHTPDALTRLLAALRPHVAGRLHVLFGAGGDRDPGKRPLMGRAAAEAADRVWITDDNPRSENPAAIRAAVMAGCPEAFDAGAREEAIAKAMGALGPGDVLAVAGKGHETGQEIAGTLYPFDDVAVVRKLAGGVP